MNRNLDAPLDYLHEIKSNEPRKTRITKMNREIHNSILFVKLSLFAALGMMVLITINSFPNKSISLNGILYGSELYYNVAPVLDKDSTAMLPISDDHSLIWENDQLSVITSPSGTTHFIYDSTNQLVKRYVVYLNPDDVKNRDANVLLTSSNQVDTVDKTESTTYFVIMGILLIIICLIALWKRNFKNRVNREVDEYITRRTEELSRYDLTERQKDRPRII